MSTQTDLKFVKRPFFICAFICDAALLSLAYFICLQHRTAPMGWSTSLVCVFTGAIGAIIAMLPFLLEYRAAVKMVETGAMVSTVSQFQNLEEIARQIGGATSQWQGVQEHSARTATTAKEISERITAEAAAFSQFLQKVNDSEKNNLRMEVEKMRRAEGDWLQIIVRLLDHTYALHQAAVRSGQPALIEQLGNFQNACRDVARRVGLAPYAPAANDAFDPKSHESSDSQATSMANARVRETIATGYTYQGQLLRRALVSLQNPPPGTTVKTSEPAAIRESNGEADEKESEVEEQTLL